MIGWFVHSGRSTSNNVTSLADTDRSTVKTDHSLSHWTAVVHLLSMGELPRQPEYSKLPMELSDVDIEQCIMGLQSVMYILTELCT